MAVLGDDVRHGGAYVHKTLWAIAPSYRGPLLVRAIGRRGQLRLGTGHRREVWLESAPGRPRRWRYAPMSTDVPGAGCYAFQLDGTSFSRTLVFRARL